MKNVDTSNKNCIIQSMIIHIIQTNCTPPNLKSHISTKNTHTELTQLALPHNRHDHAPNDPPTPIFKKSLNSTHFPLVSYYPRFH